MFSRLAFFCLHHHVSSLARSPPKSINNNVDIYSFLCGGDSQDWGTLAGLKVYEICVRKNIIVSFFTLLRV